MYTFCKKLLLSAVLLVAVSAQLVAQINLSVKNKDIRSVLQQIERTTNYRFFFGDIPGLKTTVTLDLKDASINEVLDKVLDGTGIEYTVNDYQIVLKESPRTQPQATDQVKGRVVDDTGHPLPGVFISVKGNSRASTTLSDTDGSFTVSGVSPRSVLVFQMLGFNHKEVAVGNGKNLRVVLEESREMLDDVVVIGYGSLEKRELTSSITSLKSKDFIAGNSQSPLLALSGKVTGLDIYSSAGSDPNTSISIQLRGVNSIMADQGPLVVVDGVPGGNMNILQKEDIISI
ncbi:MAG: carboxypeptidase-like regulatory domain-containing protein, partial [Bacteroidales bacterium]|nr:carboxypeptidase-like regulatory domain-containing protein [Bacteroidales bacterium]